MPTINALKTVRLLCAPVASTQAHAALLDVPTCGQPFHAPYILGFSESHMLTRWATPRKAGTCQRPSCSLGELALGLWHARRVGTLTARACVVSLHMGEARQSAR